MRRKAYTRKRIIALVGFSAFTSAMVSLIAMVIVQRVARKPHIELAK